MWAHIREAGWSSWSASSFKGRPCRLAAPPAKFYQPRGLSRSRTGRSRSIRNLNPGAHSLTLIRPKSQYVGTSRQESPKTINDPLEQPPQRAFPPGSATLGTNRGSGCDPYVGPGGEQYTPAPATDPHYAWNQKLAARR